MTITILRNPLVFRMAGRLTNGEPITKDYANSAGFTEESAIFEFAALLKSENAKLS